MINLDRFDQQQYITVPIINTVGKFNGRRISARVENGWYRVLLKNRIEVIRPATALEIHKTLKEKKHQLVYSFGNEGVPFNFDTFKREGFGSTVPVHFLSLPLFTIAKVVKWEDNRLYYFDEYAGKNLQSLRAVKDCFDQEVSLMELTGVSPELRYYYFLGNLQRESFRALEEITKFVLSEEEKNKRLAVIKEQFPNRVRLAINRSGGRFIKLYRSGKGHMVEWEINGEILKSTIRDDLRIISAGFCLSGYDKEHTLGSIIHLAKIYQSDSLLNITRF